MKPIEIEEIDKLPGIRIQENDTFSFRCHPEVECFNRCCRNLNLFLYPYDLPHSWIGAEYVLAFRDLFAFEREADESLVVAAGIPGDWLAAGEVAVSGLPTWYGRLDVRLRRTAAGNLHLSLGGEARLPPGGIGFAPELDGLPREVRVNGEPTTAFTATEVHIATFPAEVVVDFHV